jgi:catechol 2,3-dioxygenase-like lactoylglutathione lyase family enzyme
MADFETVLSFYGVRDLTATRDFYERDLGLRLARDQGSCLIFAAGAAFVGFCQRDDASALDGELAPILTFVTDEVDACYARLRRLGVETEAPPRENDRFGIYHFFARDPDGYRVEVQRFDDPLR